jgi:hypothetical protein
MEKGKVSVAGEYNQTMKQGWLRNFFEVNQKAQEKWEGPGIDQLTSGNFRLRNT